MARGLTTAERYFRRTESLALSALPVTGLTAAADQHHDGVMVALVPDNPDDIAVEHEGALPADDLHVTLCYYGKVQDLSSSDQERIMNSTRQACSEIGHPFTTTADGVVVMGKNDDGVPATALLVQSNEIVDLYDAISEATGYESKFPSFIPHMTTGYGVPAEEAEKRVGQPIKFSNVVVKFGDDRNMIPLSSSLTAASPGANVIEQVVDSLGRTWDEGLHPRDGRGLFIKKDGAVSGKMQVQTPDGGAQTVDARRASVRGFRTIDNEVWVLAAIPNPDGSTTEGYAKATEVRAVAPVKARLDETDSAYSDRVSKIREDTSVADEPSDAEVI